MPQPAGLAALVNHTRTERVILTLIILNAVALGLETSPTIMREYGPLLHGLDHALLTIFVLELLARMAVLRAAFFRDPWSLFDLFVVGIALVPATGSLSVLRALRVLRILRLVTAVPSLKRVVGGLVTALPGMGSIMLLLALIFYVFSVMAANLYGQTKPEHFGNLGAAAYTLLQVMTFDDWSADIFILLRNNAQLRVALDQGIDIALGLAAVRAVVVEELDERDVADRIADHRVMRRTDQLCPAFLQRRSSLSPPAIGKAFLLR